MPRIALLFGLLAATGCATTSTTPLDCRRVDVGVQVLGSGGPIPDDARASAGYLVWSEGEAKVLIDAGGGTFVRFGESGASLESLELIGLTHLHTDHAAELPALLKGAFFGHRSEDLPIVGPAAGGRFPGLAEFLGALFGPEGAFRYLSWLVTPGEGRFTLVPTEVSGATTVLDSRPPFTASLDDGSLRVSAVPVVHGPVPAIGFRVDLHGKSIAFTGDQNAESTAFETLAQDVDLLVVHLAIPDASDPVAHRLHRSPGEIADLARATRPEAILLSHLMARSLAALDESKTRIAAATDADVVVAEDMMCIAP
jgi:ribonuclease BN (tRNA processing enzyme)